MKKILLFLMTLFMSGNVLSWELIYQKDKITLYKGESKTSILPFRAEAVLDVPAENIFRTLMDWQRKHEWSPKLKKVILHKALGKNKFIFSEYYSTPWPAMDREFLLLGEGLQEDNGNFLFKAKSLKRSELVNKFKDSSHIQADVQTLVFKGVKLDQGKTKVIFEFKGDIKGWIPSWLSNIIQRKWPLRFIQKLRLEANKVKTS